MQTQPIHVMLDLETMGTAPGAPIVSIGAVQFDPFGDALGPQFHQAITLESCMAAGMTPDARTIEWWLRQSDEARSRLLPEERASLPAALLAFVGYLETCGAYYAPPELRLWCHGPSFDAALLDHAYRAHPGLRTPWAYNAPRDTRTVYDLAGFTADDVAGFRAAGTHHDALDDAIAQARAVQAACRKLGLVS